MAPPPLVAAADPVDPRKHPALQGWAQDVGRGILKIINNVKKWQDYLLTMWISKAWKSRCKS